MGKGSSGVQETSQQIALSKVATEQWNRYQDVFVPHTNAYLKDVAGFNAKTGKFEPIREEIKQGKVSGQINATLAQNTPTTAAPGVDPSRGNYVVGNPDAAKAAAKVQVKGVQSAKDRQITEMMKAVTLGRGQADESQSGMGDLAKQAVEDQISDVNAARQTQNAITSSIGTAAGAGLAIYGNMGSGTTKQ